MPTVYMQLVYQGPRAPYSITFKPAGRRQAAETDLRSSPPAGFATPPPVLPHAQISPPNRPNPNPTGLSKPSRNSFSIDDLAASPSKTTCWDGVRNYLARNHMRAMQLGDEVLFYHSNADPLAIVGVTVVFARRIPIRRLGTRKTTISIRKPRRTIRSGTWSICG